MEQNLSKLMLYNVVLPISYNIILIIILQSHESQTLLDRYCISYTLMDYNDNYFQKHYCITYTESITMEYLNNIKSIQNNIITRCSLFSKQASFERLRNPHSLPLFHLPEFKWIECVNLSVKFAKAILSTLSTQN